MKSFEQLITEAAYPGNVGFQEMVTFYQKASSSQIKTMENIIKKNDWKGFKKMIDDVLGISLK